MSKVEIEQIRLLIQDVKDVFEKKKPQKVDVILQLANDMFMLFQELFDHGDELVKREACRECAKFLLPLTEKLLQHRELDEIKVQDVYALYRKVYAFVSRRSLEHFIDFMEWDRTTFNKVYFNRKDVLKPFVYYLNKLVFSDTMKYVLASYPPSYGKTFVLNYFSAWSYGVKYDTSILRISYSEDLVNAMARSIKELVSSELFSEVFPNFKIHKNKPFDKEKENEWLLKGADVRTSHYARTREGAITGVRANWAIIIDDITKGATEATNSLLHSQLYDKWNSEWMNRRDGHSTKYIFAGTMWSPDDILNKIADDQDKESPLKPSKMFKHCLESEDGETVVIRMPLLDENDKVTCDSVMTQKEALSLRERMDEYLFSCVYQQQPIAPTGLEFAYENLQKFQELPPEISTYAYAVLDPARKGKDNVSMPICKVDDDGKHYVVDVLFKKQAMSELYDDIVDLVIEYKVVKLVVESNIDVSLRYVLEKKLEEKNYDMCDIIEKFSTQNKEQRISAARGIILRRMSFKDKNNYSKNSDYGRFMENLTRYSFDYANKHDDAPDSCALYSTEIILNGAKVNKVKAIDRKSLGF